MDINLIIYLYSAGCFSLLPPMAVFLISVLIGQNVKRSLIASGAYLIISLIWQVIAFWLLSNIDLLSAYDLYIMTAFPMVGLLYFARRSQKILSLQVRV
jgi:hypothetical protein